MAATLSKDLPYDIMIHILSRLPAKTLIRFRCVCKSLYYTISNPNFITTHLNRVRSCNNNDAYFQYLNVEPSPRRQFWYLLSKHSFIHHLELEIPFKSQSSSSFSFLNTFNGLACLADDSHNIYLWNPSIRKSKTLPSSTSTFPLSELFHPKNYFCTGFGFDSQTNDYKIVRILYCQDVNGEYFVNPPPLVEVFSLSTDSWRRVEVLVPSFLPYHDSNAFINGSIHWVAAKPELGEDSDRIVAFDIGDEVFREMMLPNYNIEGFEELGFSVDVLNKSLSLFVYFIDSQQCSIWVMKEYGVFESWTKQFTVIVPHGNIIYRSLALLGTMKYFFKLRIEIWIPMTLGVFNLRILESLGIPVRARYFLSWRH